MEHAFDTPEPVRLYVELGPGHLTVTAADVRTSTVQLSGSGAEETVVTEEEGEISVVAPRQRAGFLGGDTPEVHARIEVPTASQVITRCGSADQEMHGLLRMVKSSSGSGDIGVERVAEVAVLDAGSGSVSLAVAGDHTRIKTGSGDVTVGTVAGSLGISTGSGDVVVERTQADAAIKTSSGAIRVDSAGDDLTLRTGSGDVEVGVLARGAVHAKTGSGAVRLGVPPDVPVWTDISTGSGRISSDLAGAGEPAPGQEHLEIRIRTGSGDVVLEQR